MTEYDLVVRSGLVATVLAGNCGVSIAPVRPVDWPIFAGLFAKTATFTTIPERCTAADEMLDSLASYCARINDSDHYRAATS